MGEEIKKEQEKPKQEKGKTSTTKKVLLIVLPIVAVIIIILGVVLALVLGKVFGKNDEVETSKESTLSTKWGDTYFAFLSDAVRESDPDTLESMYGIAKNAENMKLQFCEIENGKDPSMVMTYEKDDNTYVNVYQVTEDDAINQVHYPEPTDIEYLYDIAKEEYGWYVHKAGETSDSYSTLKNITNSLKGNETEKVLKLEADYTITKEEAVIKQETVDGETLEYAKFDEIFVKPQVENEQFDFDKDLNLDRLKDRMEKAVNEYKTEDKRLTDTVIDEVSKKVEEIKKKVEDVKKAKEEMDKKQDFSKGIKVGSYTLQLGKYLGDEDGPAQDSWMELKADGTCTVKWSNQSSKSYTYRVGKYDFSQGASPDYREGIGVLNSDGTVRTTYFALSNTEITDGDMFSYHHESTVTQEEHKQEEEKHEEEEKQETPEELAKKALTSFEYDTSSNSPVTAGTYYRGKDTGTESILTISNVTGNSFDFSINAIYMTSAGYPNLGELTGTAKAIKGGNYVYTIKETGSYGFEYQIFFKIAGGASNMTFTIEDECYNYKYGKSGDYPYCGHNVTFDGTYVK